MAQEGVYYSFTDTNCIIRLIGEMKYTTMAPDFEKFIDILLGKDEITEIIVDMRECTYIDSTDLGILARIAVTQAQRQAPQPLIVLEAGAVVEKTIYEIGLGHLFNLATTVELGSAEFTEVKDGGAQDELALAKLMVGAHQQLVDIDENNREKFAAVIEFMEQEIAEKELENQ